jgi:ADP-ribose pyrophosphatase YjhB (NUDIX family)
MQNLDKPEIQRIAMKAVIYNDNHEILILQEAGDSYSDGVNEGKWQLPGGRIEIGENWRDGLDREVLEETGLKVNIIKPIFIGEWHPVIKSIKTQIIAVFNICKYIDGAVKISQEHSDYKWINKPDIDKYIFTTPDDEVLRESFKELAKGDK